MRYALSIAATQSTPGFSASGPPRLHADLASALARPPQPARPPRLARPARLARLARQARPSLLERGDTPDAQVSRTASCFPPFAPPSSNLLVQVLQDPLRGRPTTIRTLRS